MKHLSKFFDIINQETKEKSLTTQNTILSPNTSDIKINNDTDIQNETKDLEIITPDNKEYLHPEYEEVVYQDAIIVKKTKCKKVPSILKPSRMQLKLDKEVVSQLVLSLPDLGVILLKNKANKFCVKYKDPIKKKTYRIHISLQDFNT